MSDINAARPNTTPAQNPLGNNPESAHTRQNNVQNQNAEPRVHIENPSPVAETGELSSASIWNGSASRPIPAREWVSAIKSYVDQQYSTPLDQVREHVSQMAESDAALFQDFFSQAVEGMEGQLKNLRDVIRLSQFFTQSSDLNSMQLMNQLKFEQGGLFWSKLQNTLGQGFTGDMNLLFQFLNSSSSIGEFLDQVKNGAIRPNDSAMNSQQALLALIKVDINPQSMEQFLGLLKTFKQETVAQGSEKMIRYFKSRGFLSDQDMKQFLNYRFDGSLSERLKKEKPKSAFIYLILSVLSFFLFWSLGLSLSASFALGLTLIIIFYMASYFLGK